MGPGDQGGGAGLIREHQTLAGRYEIDVVLGRGGMAEVYRGTDRVLSRTVAVKVLPASLASDPTNVDRFRREARSAAGLNHPNVVGVYDTGSDGDVHFIVMEYVDGRTLEEALGDEGPLSPDRATHVAAAVALGLEVAHREGLVHRDVKPGNIMLTKDGGVKVMDFGIARALSSQTLTQTGTVFGTATYLSPEQARGEPVDARSDLYSLGVVLYEVLTGRPPFEGETAMAVATKHLTEQPVPPRRLAPGVPQSLEEVTLRAMAKDAGERYQTAGELREDLERVARGERPLLGVAAGRAGAGAGIVAATDAPPGSATAPIAPARTSVLPAAPPAPAGAPPSAPAGPPGRRTPVAPLVVAGLVLLAALSAALLLGGDGGPPGAPNAGQPSPTRGSADLTPAERVDAAFTNLRDLLQHALDDGGIQPEAFGRIARRAEASSAAYHEDGNVERAVSEVGKLSDELDKAAEREDISEEWAAVLGEQVDALGLALSALIPAETTTPADETTPPEETTGEEEDD
jgi:predicted Ser/Thr protein kinase